MECGPIGSSVVAFKDMLDNAVSLAEKIGGSGIFQMVIKASGTGCDIFLPETRDVPNSYSLVQRCGYQEVIGGVETSAHDIVVMTG